MSFAGWIASLSNGQTVFEEPPVPGEKSSWQKLLDRLAAENLKITQLRLQHGGLVIVCDHHKKIQGYCMAYEALKIMFRETEQRFQGIGSVMNDMVFMTWTDGNGHVRQDIRPLSEMRVHTTLKDAQDARDTNPIKSD